MLNLLNSITAAGMTTGTFLLCILLSVALGIGTALVFSYRTKYTPSMSLSLAIMPGQHRSRRGSGRSLYAGPVPQHAGNRP